MRTDAIITLWTPVSTMTMIASRNDRAAARRRQYRSERSTDNDEKDDS